MLTVLSLRLAKLLVVSTFFAGIVGTFSAPELAQRRRWADRHAAPGFVLTWALGVGLASVRGDSLVSRWIVGAVILSTLAIWATLAQAHLRRERSRPLSAVASLGFTGALALMVFRP